MGNTRNIENGGGDPSPRKYKARDHYQDEQIVSLYEEKRFSGFSGWLRDRMERRAVRRALRGTGRGLRVLDLPCGTGRFTSLLRQWDHHIVQADISWEMLQFSKARSRGQDHIVGFVRCEAESLPFRSGAFDLILCFRFLPHLPVPARKKALAELARLSDGHLIIDYRYKYAFRSLSRAIRHRLGMAKRLRPRYSLSDISSELNEAGLMVVRWIPVVWLFSEKVVLVCRRAAPRESPAPAASPGE